MLGTELRKWCITNNKSHHNKLYTFYIRYKLQLYLKKYMDAKKILTQLNKSGVTVSK